MGVLFWNWIDPDGANEFKMTIAKNSGDCGRREAKCLLHDPHYFAPSAF